MTDRTLTLAGWWLFMLCAILFLIASSRAGDWIAFAGSLAFLLANILFMLPYYRRSSARASSNQE